MYIGNIIIDEEFSKTVNYESVNIVDEFTETEIPTLLVGWERTKELFPEVSILNKKIKENLYWTFSPREKRGIYEDDLKSFMGKLNDDLFKKVELINIDPILYNIKDTKTLIGRLKRFSNSEAYLYGDKIYFYHENKIYHLDLFLLEFIEFDLEIIKDFFEVNFNMIKEYEVIDNIDVKYIPYIYHRNATKNNPTSDIHQS